MAAPLDRMHDAMRRDGIDEDRAQRSLYWARAFLDHAGSAEPQQLGRQHLEKFLEHLARERFAGRPAQNRAMDAVRMLYRGAVGSVPPWLQIMFDERRPIRGPNIVSRDEVRQLMAQLHGTQWLAAALVYGTGIRLIECVRLRIRDVDLTERSLKVCDAAGEVQREVGLPQSVIPRLEERIEDLRREHIGLIGNGAGLATLPPGIAERRPEVGRMWGWQYLFPLRRAAESTLEPVSREPVHHMDPVQVHRQIEQAARAAKIHRRVTGHVLRNSYAIHLIQQGVPVRRVEQLLGTTPDDLPACTRDDERFCLEVPLGASTSSGGAGLR